MLTWAHSSAASYVSSADVHCSYMYNADVHCSYMYNADVHCSYMYNADVHCSYMYNADAHCSYMYSADVRCSYMYSADVCCSYMYSADVHCSYMHSADVHCSMQMHLICRTKNRLVGLVVEASASRMADLVSNPASAVGPFPGGAEPVTWKLVLQTLPCQVLGVIGQCWDWLVLCQYTVTENFPFRRMSMQHRSSNPQPHPAVPSCLQHFETPDMAQSGGGPQEALGTG